MKPTAARKCFALCRFIAGKIINSRQSLMRSARETGDEAEKSDLKKCAEDMSDILRWLDREAENLDSVRGFEGPRGKHLFRCVQPSSAPAA